jgi:hypothetical protein
VTQKLPLRKHLQICGRQNFSSVVDTAEDRFATSFLDSFFFFFFFRWRYSLLWALAYRTIPLHFSLSPTHPEGVPTLT